MKKKFKVTDIDCASCAAKIEEQIGKIDGVEKASLSFMTQKLIIKGDDDKMDKIVKEAKKIALKIEPDAGFEEL